MSASIAEAMQSQKERPELIFGRFKRLSSLSARTSLCKRGLAQNAFYIKIQTLSEEKDAFLPPQGKRSSAYFDDCLSYF